ncbi:MAG: MATE family efflux transporter [Bacteroidales bacterium]|nr:MATE family efflux transporter [Bacteroidales bacterium]MDD4209302.1 MATE family efflux transporter [Bacteroidales bacterium]
MSVNQSPLVLGYGNIGKLLWQYSIPSIIAMVATSLYNIIDSIFIGHGVGAMAISGLAITFPFMNLGAAFGSLIGVGGAAIMSVRLGAKDKRSAEEILGNLVLLNVISGLFFSVFCLIFLDPILLFFGASDVTLPYARSFMKVLLYGNVITHLYFGLNGLIRSSGYPTKAMITVLISVMVNFLLAPLFIFVFKWGMTGAALATLLAQFSALIFELFHFFNKKSYIRFLSDIFKLKKDIVYDIISIGVAPFLLNACASFIVIVINRKLLFYGGDLAVGAFGIVNRLSMLFIMIVLGLTQGMQPIVGYNFGAKQYDRVLKTFKYTVFYAVGITSLGFLLGEIFPTYMVSLFTTDSELIRLSKEGLQISMAIFPIVGFQMVVSQFFQSIGKAKQAVFLSVSRQMLFLLPVLFILPNFFGSIGVWLSLPVSDFLATLVALGLIIKQLNTFKK